MLKFVKQKKGEDAYKEKYESLLKEYEEFTYIISHDLKAPLRQVKGFIGMLISEANLEPTEQQQLYLNMIQHAAANAEGCLEGLLTFSRITTVERKDVALDINGIIAECISDLEPLISRNQVDVSVQGELPDVTGDRALIKRMFFAVIENAVKFHDPERAVTAQVFVTGEVRDGNAVYRIKDNGLGIRENKHEEIFGIFRKLNADDDFEGEGLGLTFARKIAGIYGGDIIMDSVEDESSAFDIIIPLTGSVI